MARISGKLTPKAIGWDRNAIGAAVKKVPQDSGRVFLGRIVGIVNGFKQTVSEETGEVQTGLKGSFRGLSSLNEVRPVLETVNIDGKDVERPKRDANDQIVTLDTGNKITTTAGVCYLPGGLQGMIEAAYNEAASADKNATVRFGLDLFAIPATNKAGYSFDADTLVEASENDPLADLLSSAGKQAELPAPTDMSAPDVEGSGEAPTGAEAAEKVGAKRAK